jgi:hypothetical protein
MCSFPSDSVPLPCSYDYLLHTLDLSPTVSSMYGLKKSQQITFTLKVATAMFAEI